ncbi:hypothetical protein [Cytobacillus kochii]
MFTAALKFLSRKNSMKPNLEVEQKLDQIIELLQSEANRKR